MPSLPLTDAQRRTCTAIFQYPSPPDLDWSSVCALLDTLGEVTEEPDGNLRVTRNGQTLALHQPRAHDVAGTSEIMAMRHFIEQSESVSLSARNG
ncbi:hypothetical protein OH491_05785 [Termitidicoccus mucosus]|uniref:HicA protein n=1 Tax=Termitidicoccus mucosus TaxID=1184151 RepID=A0A178IEZ1_9BACT|nr:hypothetical protein AW736_19195 [Opitutaceae bacterium TSB47]